MLYDITPPITQKLAVWPGDTPPSREVLLEEVTTPSGEILYRVRPPP